MSDSIWRSLKQQIRRVEKIRLFLDYDGTLADFAPAPDIILPDPALISLLSRLVETEKYLTAVISGRSLLHLRELLPMKGLLLAGTYGLEMQFPDGSLVTALDYGQVRPLMEKLLPKWQALLDGQVGFFLEDKGWSLAMHARFAAIEDARRVLDSARGEIDQLSAGEGFAVEHRARFLEITPVEANKRRSVETILSRYTPAKALPIYMGDDLNDEEAFDAILTAGGVCLRVSKEPVPTRAQHRLSGPREVRQLLNKLAGSD